MTSPIPLNNAIEISRMVMAINPDLRRLISVLGRPDNPEDIQNAGTLLENAWSALAGTMNDAVMRSPEVLAVLRAQEDAA